MKALDNLIARNTIPHALLFVGPPESEKEKAALEFAANLIGDEGRARIHSGNHPDIHIYRPEGKTGMHPIQSLRSLSDEAAMCPNEGRYKVFILHEAERMLPTSSNALLKTFEEPEGRTVIILLTAHPERLLPTVRSRCRLIPFQGSRARQHDSRFIELLEKEPAFAEIEAFASSVEAERKEWEKASEGEAALKYQERVFALLNTYLEWHRDIVALEQGISDDLLFFPQKKAELLKQKPRSLSRVEAEVKQARLAVQRSIKLSAIFENLFSSHYQLSNL